MADTASYDGDDETSNNRDETKEQMEEVWTEEININDLLRTFWLVYSEKNDTEKLLEEGNIGQREPTQSPSNGESNAVTNTIQNIQKPEPLMARPIPKPSRNKQTSNKKNTGQVKANLVPGPRLYKMATSMRP